MQTGNEAYIIQDNGWTVRIQPPVDFDAAQAAGHRCMLLLHGWRGDETVMWIFARDLPANTWIFAPRAPLESPEGGYGWMPHAGSLPTLQEFAPVAETLERAFEHWRQDAVARFAASMAATADLPNLVQTPADVMGFSQGAGMSYALAAFYPTLINRVIGLAGFLPKEDPLPGRYAALRGKNVYIAHGSRDETIPVALAQQSVRVLQEAGAQVTYCESDIGHKLSADCLRGLKRFLS